MIKEIILTSTYDMYIVLVILLLLVIEIFSLKKEMKVMLEGTNNCISDLILNDIGTYYFFMELLILKGIINLEEGEQATILNKYLEEINTFNHFVESTYDRTQEEFEEYMQMRKRVLGDLLK